MMMITATAATPQSMVVSTPVDAPDAVMVVATLVVALKLR
jgi:hypothetical protein